MTDSKTSAASAKSPFSDYEILLFFPDKENVYLKLGLKRLVPKLQRLTEKYLGAGLPLEVLHDDRYRVERKTGHEILFGPDFVREGIPAFDPHKSFYGVTEDGTVYFRSPAYMLYPYLWEIFLKEFAGGGLPKEGCYREISPFDPSELEREGYRKVFEDDFGGDSIDETVWACRGSGPRRCGYQSASQARVENGELILTGSYEPEGEFGPGWYGIIMMLKKPYCRGYFEARIRCCETHGRTGDDFWSAFWIQGPSPYDGKQSQGGIGPGGCEIDVMENWGKDYTSSCFWVSGVEGEDDLSGELFQVQDTGNDYVNDYHVYACLWDENVYKVYVDGMLTGVTDHAYGTSKVAEDVLISIELPAQINLDQDTRREMRVSSVRIWQKAEE